MSDNEYTPQTEDVRQRFALDVDASPVTDRDYATALVEFDQWLAEVRAKAIDDAANFTASYYPETVFAPMTDADHRSVNDALAGRAERTSITRDRVSADAMRRACALVRQYAAEIREGNFGQA